MRHKTNLNSMVNGPATVVAEHAAAIHLPSFSRNADGDGALGHNRVHERIVVVDRQLDVAGDGGDRNNLGRLAAGVFACIWVVRLGGDARGDLSRVLHCRAAAASWCGAPCS